jgi:secreted trypsin-like serine protease
VSALDIHFPDGDSGAKPRCPSLVTGMLAALALAAPCPAASGASPRIIGGTDVAPGDLPWTVTLVDHFNQDTLSGQVCGGTLIHPQWVLTAGHCFADRFGRLVSVPDLDAVIGRRDLSTTNGVRMTPDRMIPHPDWAYFDFFRGLPLRNDLLLLHLPAPVTSIPPVRLPGQSFDAFFVIPGEISTAAGWGVTTRYGWTSSAVLQEVGLPIVDQPTCADAESALALLDTTLCAGPQPAHQDTCSGDSGGPLLVPRGSDGHWEQVGITSYGQSGCAQDGYYGVYTRVSRYVQWISDTVCGDAEIPAQPDLSLWVSGHLATASFSPVANASGYRLYYAPGPQMSPIQYLDLGTQTSYAVELPSGSDYFVAVQAYNGVCLSPYSDILHFTIP